MEAETHLASRGCQVLPGLFNLLMVSAGQQLCAAKWRSQTSVSEMGSCSPEMLHGVVLSPDYDGPCGTPFVVWLYASNWQTKAGELRGIWPGNNSLLSQPKRVSGEDVTVPREGWTLDGWMDAWLVGEQAGVEIDGWMEFFGQGWSLSQTLRGHLDCSYWHG